MKRNFVIGKYTLESLTNGMYTSPLDMYREYIQNAVDSFDIAIEKELAIMEKLRIDINIDTDKKSITIRDNGCGVPSDLAVRTLLDIGNSKKSRMSSRGFRGIGRLAGLSYCDKLSFRTSYHGEEVATIIEFDAFLLRKMLFDNSTNNQSVEEVFEKIVTIRSEKETIKRQYFEVKLEGIWDQSELTDVDTVYDYLIQQSPLHFSKNFKWGRTIVEKIRMDGYLIPQYKIYLNGEELFKPYQDSFLSDRVRRQSDNVKDIKTKIFYRDTKPSAIIWYAETNYYGTIFDVSIKGLRIRHGNILVGDRTTCNFLFKEERFNGWMIGEIHILDPNIIINSRRDGFEKNDAYLQLEKELKEWANSISKDIRHISYQRSLSEAKKSIIEAEMLDDIQDVNGLNIEDFSYADDYSENSILEMSESDEIAETDYITKLGILFDQKKSQTKYAALNINSKLTIEQRKVLERVFDLLTEELDKKEADKIVNIISQKY